MARCLVCRHPHRETIESGLIDPRATIAGLAKKFDLTEACLYRHRDNHLTEMLAIGESEREAAGTVALRAKAVAQLQWWESRLTMGAKFLLPITPEEAAELGFYGPTSNDDGSPRIMTMIELAQFNRAEFNPFGLAGLAKSACQIIELRAKVDSLIGNGNSNLDQSANLPTIHLITLPAQLPAGTGGQSLGRRLGSGMAENPTVSCPVSDSQPVIETTAG